jgi:predicted nucleic acid-binding protein
VARVLVDTSAVFALLDRSDANHAAARRTLQQLAQRRVQPVLTNFIVAESHALALTRLGADVARRWLQASVWPVERVGDDDESKARSIIASHTDKRYSYTDATSFAVMERLRLREVFAFDPHFRQYGFQVIGLVSPKPRS